VPAEMGLGNDLDVAAEFLRQKESLSFLDAMESISTIRRSSRPWRRCGRFANYSLNGLQEA